jgi:galactokinase
VADPPRGLRALLDRAARAYTARFGGAPRWVGWGPGRVNIIGEHTDYNQGLAMPAAIDRWVVVALGPRTRGGLAVRSEDFDDSFELEPGAELSPGAPSWQRFAVGCVVELTAAHPIPHGLQAVVAGDVPLGAGLSSSAAVEMAWLNALRLAAGASLDDLELARLGQRVEHDHLQLASGLLDQLASQLSRPDALMVLDFEDLSVSWVDGGLPGWDWLVVDSGVRRELAGSAYRERVRECADGLERAQRFDPDLEGFRGLRGWHLQVLEELGHGLPARRLGHVLSENRRVLGMQGALARGDASLAGRLLRASHTSLRVEYQVSCAELDAIVDLCCAWRGCAGARMVGGGFGGCVLALVRRDAREGLPEYLAQAYGARFAHGLRCWRFGLVAGAGADRWQR